MRRPRNPPGRSQLIPRPARDLKPVALLTATNRHGTPPCERPVMTGWRPTRPAAFGRKGRCGPSGSTTPGPRASRRQRWERFARGGVDDHAVDERDALVDAAERNRATPRAPPLRRLATLEHVQGRVAAACNLALVGVYLVRDRYGHGPGCQRQSGASFHIASGRPVTVHDTGPVGLSGLGGYARLPRSRGIPRRAGRTRPRCPHLSANSRPESPGDRRGSSAIWRAPTLSGPRGR